MTTKIQLKDQDYVGKRNVVRSAFAGDHAAPIEAIAGIDTMRYMNVIRCYDIMREAEYTTEQIEAHFNKTAREGYSALEIIRTETFVNLRELDPATLVPRTSGANGDYQHTFVQYIGTDNERVINDEDILYMAMPYTFNSIIDTIDKGL